MLSKEEIRENSKTLSVKEYSEMLTEIYLSRSAKEKCIELEQINEMLKYELEKYKRIALGSVDEKETVISEIYDQLLNEADIVCDRETSDSDETYDSKSEMEEIAQKIRSFPPNDAMNDYVNYIFRIYNLDESLNSCDYCDGKYRVVSSFPCGLFKIIENKAIWSDEIFVGYKCDKCGAEIPNGYEKTKRAFSLSDNTVSAEAAANIFIQKYVYGRSYKTQEVYWKSHDLELSQITMCKWMNEVCDGWLIPLYEEMKKNLLKRDFVCADVNGIRNYRISNNEMVLHENKMMDVYVYRTPENDQHPVIIFDYDIRCSNEYEPVRFDNPMAFLKGFKGIVHTEKIERFDFPGRKFSFAAMWSRVGDLFEEALDNIMPDFRDDSEAMYCMNLCRKIEEKEKDVNEIDEDDAKLEIREIVSRDITDILLESAASFITDQKDPNRISLIGKAYQYILDHADELELYYTDPRTNVDNELCNAALEGFSGLSDKLAVRENGYRRCIAAVSIIQTAVCNNLNPLRYIIYYLKNKNKKTKGLMPWNCPEQCKEILLQNNKPKNTVKKIKYQ